MTKADIIAEIVSSTGVAKKDVAVTIEAFMNVIRDNMVDGENIYLRGFGTFVVKKRAEKTARNISKNTTITIIILDIRYINTSLHFRIYIKRRIIGIPSKNFII